MQLVDRGTLWSGTPFTGTPATTSTVDTVVASPGRDSATILLMSTAAGTLSVKLTFDLITGAEILSQAVVANTLYRIVLADGHPGGEISLSFTSANSGVLHARVECGGPVDCVE